MKSSIQKSTFLAWALFILVATSCSKDDPEPSVFIKIKETKTSYTAVNGCDVGGGLYYTRFYFTIPYEASPDIEIAKISYSAAAPGGTSKQSETTVFDDDESEVAFSLCLKFGGAPSIDFTTTLESSDGIKSNVNKISIVHPDGAN